MIQLGSKKLIQSMRLIVDIYANLLANMGDDTFTGYGTPSSPNENDADGCTTPHPEQILPSDWAIHLSKEKVDCINVSKGIIGGGKMNYRKYRRKLLRLKSIRRYNCTRNPSIIAWNVVVQIQHL